MNPLPKICLTGLILAAAFSTIPAPAAENTAAPAAAPLFDDPVLARGKNLEIKQSQVDEMFAAFRANRSAAGQQIPSSARPKIEADILDKLIATRLCVARATADDRAKAEQTAKEFIAEQMRAVPSEQSFNRQLLAVGLTPEQFKAQILEQAIVKAVLDRELKAKFPVTEAQARKFYDENAKLFEQPEMVRVLHLLISTLDSETGRELPGEVKLQKRQLAEKLHARAKAGEDFKQLADEFSEDRNAKSRGGEYTITRNDRRFVLTPEFEGAAFSVPTNQVTDIVTSSYGYHIVKGLEKIPPRKAEFEKVRERITDSLVQESVQKALPEFIESLRKEAGVEILKPGQK